MRDDMVIMQDVIGCKIVRVRPGGLGHALPAGRGS